MKSIRMAIYASIVMHFLRMTAGKLLRTAPRLAMPPAAPDPVEEINRYKLEVLKSDRIHLLRDNFRNCPNPCLLAKIMQEAAISVILREASPHC